MSRSIDSTLSRVLAPSASRATAAQFAPAQERDEIYAPADVSPTPLGPIPLGPTPLGPGPRQVRTLTNSPGCAPTLDEAPTADRLSRRPSQRMQLTPTRAWALPAPATWGRVRRSGPARVAPRASSDWKLPF